MNIKTIDIKIVLRFIVMIIVAFLVGIFFSNYFKFSTDTLLWLCSTVVQAFGALIAIILVIGLHHREEVKTNFANLVRFINEQTNLYPDNIESHRAMQDQLRKALIEEKKSKESYLIGLKPVIESIIFLIGFSLTMILIRDLIDEAFKFEYAKTNLTLGFALSLIVISSIYCLWKLMKQVYVVLEK